MTNGTLKVHQVMVLSLAAIQVACSSATEPFAPSSAVSYAIGTNTLIDRLAGVPINVIVRLQPGVTRARIQIRPACALNVTLLRGATQIGSVPETVTCPDSLLTLTLDSAGQPAVFQLYQWQIPPTLDAGTVTIRAELLVTPSLQASTTASIPPIPASRNTPSTAAAGRVQSATQQQASAVPPNTR